MKTDEISADIESRIESVDHTKNGEIDYTGKISSLFEKKFFLQIIDYLNKDFTVAAMNRKNLLSKKRLSKAFKIFDKVKFRENSVEILLKIYFFKPCRIAQDRLL